MLLFRTVATLLCIFCLLLPATSMAKDKNSVVKQNLPVQDLVNAKKYSYCITLARNDPIAALSEAMAWATKNGGEPASHCHALAMIGLHDFSSGAEKLELLAQSSRYSKRIRAGLLGQAAQAWILAKEPGKSLDDLNKALQLIPDAPDLLIDRSTVFADQEDYSAALADLDMAIQLNPSRVDSLTLRASAKRHLSEYDGAKADVNAAIKINPEYQDAWMERGMLCFHDGDYFGAYEAFEKTLSIAPDTEAAAMAKENLHALINAVGLPVSRTKN